MNLNGESLYLPPPVDPLPDLGQGMKSMRFTFLVML